MLGNPILLTDPDGRSPEGGCPGCGFVTSWLADKAAAAGYNRVAGVLDAIASTDLVYANVQSTKALVNADSGGDVVKALDPTGITSIPDAVEAAASGDERAQGQLAAGGALFLATRKIGGGKKFNGKQSTNNVTSKEAFRNAKDQNGIPRSQQPDKTIKPNTPDGKNAGLDSRNVKQYEFTNSKGEKIIIRQDKPAKYGSPNGAGDQGPHYNAGKAGSNLSKQHHNYEK